LDEFVPSEELEQDLEPELEKVPKPPPYVPVSPVVKAFKLEDEAARKPKTGPRRKGRRNHTIQGHQASHTFLQMKPQLQPVSC
jgi:hypothetical protein